MSSIIEFFFAYARSSKLDKSSVEITMSIADKNDTLALARHVKARLDDMIQIQSSANLSDLSSVIFYQVSPCTRSSLFEQLT